MHVYKDDAWRASIERQTEEAAIKDMLANATQQQWFTFYWLAEWMPSAGAYGEQNMEYMVSYKLNPARVEKLRVVELPSYAAMTVGDLALTATGEIQRRLRRRFSWWRRHTLPKRAQEFIRAVAPWHYAEEDARKERIWRAIKDKVK